MTLLRDNRIKPLNVTALNGLFAKYEATGRPMPRWAIIHQANEKLAERILDRGLNVQLVRSILGNELVLRDEPLTATGKTYFSIVQDSLSQEDIQMDFLDLAGGEASEDV